MVTVKQIDAARPKEKSYRLVDSAGLYRSAGKKPSRWLADPHSGTPGKKDGMGGDQKGRSRCHGER